jgi:hypothetical protein
MPKYTVPFFSNTPDDTHCYQACIKMIAATFWPGEEYSWEELDRITAKKEGLWTWPMAGKIWLTSKGAEVKVVEEFDYQRFADEGGQYLIDEYGQEVGEAQIAHSDIPQEQKLAAQFVKETEIEFRVPDVEEIKRFLDDGYLVLCNVNSNALNERAGYTGHFVVIYDADEDGFYLQDPGLPPSPQRYVKQEIFEKAWSYPNQKARNISAVRLRT